MNIKNLALASLIIIISGCSSSPSHVVIAPQVLNGSSSSYLQKEANITVSDLRTGSHVVQVLRADEATQLFSSQLSLSNIIEKTITSAFKQRGLVVNNQANNNIEIIIDSALISVQQELMKYKANNVISLRVTVENSEKTLTQTFKSKGDSNGALTADLAVLERDFNRQLAGLLTQIVDSKEIQEHIK